jgi:hypothetical protein
MTAIKRITRQITGALFTLTLGDVFDWGTGVPVGERPRYLAPSSEGGVPPHPLLDHGWTKPDRFRPSVG